MHAKQGLSTCSSRRSKIFQFCEEIKNEILLRAMWSDHNHSKLYFSSPLTRPPQTHLRNERRKHKTLGQQNQVPGTLCCKQKYQATPCFALAKNTTFSKQVGCPKHDCVRSGVSALVPACQHHLHGRMQS